MRLTRTLIVSVVLGTVSMANAADPWSPRVRPLPEKLRGHDTAVSQMTEATTMAGSCEARSTGGPDPFGYSFIDSNEPGGPVFDWVELSGSGNQLLLQTEGYAGPLPLGFDFTFYDQVSSDFFVDSSGVVSLTYEEFRRWEDCPLPDPDPPNRIIALMWDVLDPEIHGDPVWHDSFAAGSCPYGDYTGACLVVEYENYHDYYDVIAGTFELILLDDNSFVMQFLDAGDKEGLSSTTGIESAGGVAGLTYACHTSGSLTDSLAIRFERSPLPPVALSAEDPAPNICPRTAAIHDLTLINNTGSATSFDILYSGFDWNVSGEATIGPLAQGGVARFSVHHWPPDDALPGAADSGTVTALAQQGPEASSLELTTTVARYVVTTGPNAPYPRMDHAVVAHFHHGPTNPFIAAIAGFDGSYPLDAPANPVAWSGLPEIGTVSPEATVNDYRIHTGYWYVRDSDLVPIPFPGDMAYGIDVSGEAVAVAFPDATGLADLLLHIFKFDGSSSYWTRAPLPDGFPPNGIWAHDIACDDASNTCYITGGASAPGGGDLTILYAYDVGGNTVTPLPPFTSPRAHHASFLLGGLLCIAGGIDVNDTALDSTQCYDIAAASWRPENTDLGPLPGTLWGMADATMDIDGAPRPVMAAGIYNDGPPGTHLLWHDGAAWRYDSPFVTGAYRAEADVFDDEMFLVGGSTGGMTPTNALQTLHWCPAEIPTYADCEGAIDLTYLDCVTVSNELAGDSGPPPPSCADYRGGDVWARLTLFVGEEIWVNTEQVYNPPPVSDTGMSVYAECPHQIELQCNDDIWPGTGFSQVGPLTGPGTYWVRVWEKGNDTFGEVKICADRLIPVELLGFEVE